MLYSNKSKNFSWKHVQFFFFFIIDKMASRAGWNDFAGRIWPAGRSLETPALDHETKTMHLILPLNVHIIIHLLKKIFLLKIIIKYEPKIQSVCFFLLYALLGGNGSICQIRDTGHLGLCAWNFEFLKNLSMFLFFVSIFHSRKAKLKQTGYMKQHCWTEATLKSWVITISDFYELLSICIEMIAFYCIL